MYLEYAFNPTFTRVNHPKVGPPSKKQKKTHVNFRTFIFQPSIVRQEMLVFMGTIPEEVALEKSPFCLIRDLV